MIIDDIKKDFKEKLDTFDIASINIGTNVIHKAFGKGTVIKLTNDKITIRFYNKKGRAIEKLFMFPGAFIQGFLKKSNKETHKS